MRHLLLAVERSLQAGNHYAALALALAFPDICGWVEDPNSKSKARYISWFEKYLQSKYTRPATTSSPEHVFLTGSDCYALRCAYLHEGREDIADQGAQRVLESFQFVVPPTSWIVHLNQIDSTLQLQVDIFCREVLDGVRQFLADVTNNSDASARLTKMILIRDINGLPIQ